MPDKTACHMTSCIDTYCSLCDIDFAVFDFSVIAHYPDKTTRHITRASYIDICGFTIMYLGAGAVHFSYKATNI